MQNEKKTIWIVEDHDSISRALEKMLRNKYNIRIFPTADEAVEDIKKIESEALQAPDLIITDNHTKSIKTGLDVLDAAKEASIKTIMYSFDQIEMLAKAHGAVKFVLKGSDNDKLISAIEEVINQTHDLQTNNTVISR